VFHRTISRFRRDLRFQIAFYYLLFVVPVVVVVFFFGRDINDRLRAEVMAADTALARSLAQDLGLNLTNARYAAQELARYSRTGEIDPRTLESLYNKFNLARSLVNPVTLLGDWWIVENPVPLGLDVVPPDAFPFRDFARMSQLGGPVISNGRRSIQTHQPVATSIVPLWDEREKVFEYVVSNIKLTALSDALEHLLQAYQHESYTFDAVVIDAARHIVAHPDPSLLLTSPNDLPAEVLTLALSGQSGSGVYPDADGVDTLYSYAPIAGTDWGMIISRPADTAFATANAFIRSMVIVVAFFLVVGILFWLELSRQVIHPLEHLDAFGQSIRTDEMLPIEDREELTILANRPDQVGHLTDTLIRMEAAIDARLDALIQSLRDALILENLEGRIVYANRQMGLLVERPVDEIVGADWVRAHGGVVRTIALKPGCSTTRLVDKIKEANE
jgi:PAS domain-containing protein